jgi:hypothetical protein
MTIENWIAVGAVVVTFLAGIGAAAGPAISVLLQHRLNNPRPERPLRWRRRTHERYLILGLLLIGNIVNVAAQVRGEEPVTRGDVLIIAVSVVTCFAVVLDIAFVYALDAFVTSKARTNGKNEFETMTG